MELNHTSLAIIAAFDLAASDSPTIDPTLAQQALEPVFPRKVCQITMNGVLKDEQPIVEALQACSLDADRIMQAINGEADNRYIESFLALLDALGAAHGDSDLPQFFIERALYGGEEFLAQYPGLKEALEKCMAHPIAQPVK